MRIAKYFVIPLMMVMATVSAMAQVEFVGNSKPVYVEGHSSSTGSMAVYVLYSVQGVSMQYTANTDPYNVSWQEIIINDIGERIYNDIDVLHNGNVTSLTQVKADQGYIIKEGDSQTTYLWVIDYSKHRLHINSVSIDQEDSDCGTAILHVDGSGPEIRYDGTKTLDREIKVTYNTLEWDEEDVYWKEQSVVEEERFLKNTIAVPAPYCNTTFTVSGDKFLEFWNEKESKTSETFTAIAIDVETSAVQEERDNDNEQKIPGSALGGSAPARITFTAHCTDAVSFKQWQVSDNPDFNYILMDFAQEEVEYTFEEVGTTYWRFYYANSDGSCEDYSDTYTVNIGESDLVCPNIFSPGTTEEVNDVWKVSYKSIIDFHCWIYNRWGVLIKEFTDPSDGWDGTYRGKLVGTGVYFYVIRATGSDGKKYKLSGDINILRYEHRDMGGGTMDGPVD
jgi:gliding motility-associated-like protein